MRKRLTRDGNALQSEAASSISSGLSVVGKIIGDGALTIFWSRRGRGTRLDHRDRRRGTDRLTAALERVALPAGSGLRRGRWTRRNRLLASFGHDVGLLI